VIDAEEHAVARTLPARVALARRELEDLERVPIRVLEVERANTAGIRVRIVTTRTRAPATPSRRSTSGPDVWTSATFSKKSTVE
jgi:hypothetical protein